MIALAPLFQYSSPAPAGLLFPIPPISHRHSRALAERNLRLRPSQTCGPIGGNRRLEIIDTGDVHNDVVSSIVPQWRPDGRNAGLHSELSP
jgi:hypothetical protein